ncbi:MAG TPA: DUF4870 domain-containing protein [Candidatus Tumulicola sp.]|jgi:hypothetical protein
MIQTLDPAERTDRNWGVAAHLSALLAGGVVPFGNIIGPLVVYLQNRETRPFATQHAKAALNFQITLMLVVLLAIIVTGVACIGLFGTAIAASGSDGDANLPPTFFPFVFGAGGFLVVVGILSFVWSILGAIAASQGRPYRYPVSMYFVK